MKIHYLKTWPVHFWPLRRGQKTFEIRKNDRDYQIGDVLVCKEYIPKEDRYSGELCCFYVPHMLTNQPFVPPEYVAMSVIPIPHEIVKELEKIYPSEI